MASADQLRADLSRNRESLREAMRGAEARWEDATGGEEWSVRKNAEHAIGVERLFAGRIAAGIQGKAPERKPLELATLDQALAELDETAAAVDKLYRYIEDRDLGKAAEPVSTAYPSTIEGLLQHAVDHLAEHTRNIGAVPAAS